MGAGRDCNLYQIEGSSDGVVGVFLWMIDQSGRVTHRKFMKKGKINGQPNSKEFKLVMRGHLNWLF